MAIKGFKKSDISTIKWLCKICKSQVYKVVALVFLCAFDATFTVMYANFSKNIIDAAVKEGSKERVLYYGMCFIGIILFELVLSLIIKSIGERCKGRVEMILKSYMLKTIIRKDYSKITAIHSGDLQNRMFSDVGIITDGFITILPNCVNLITRLVCAFTYLVVIDRIFAIILVIFGSIVFVGTQVFRKPLKNFHIKVQETEGITRSFIQETLLNLLVVKTFTVEEKIVNKTDELQEQNYKAKMRRRAFTIGANAIIGLIFNGGFIFSLVFGAIKLVEGTITYGTVTAMLQLVNQIQGPFASLSSIVPKYFTMLASAQRLMEIDSLPDEAATNDDDIDVEKTYNELKSIDFDNITYSYDRDYILKDTSLKIDKGDFVAIMGISGIGKSTLLKLLLGVYQVQNGSIKLDLDNGSIPVDMHTRKLFSYVPQGNMLLSGTIRDNLTFINDKATDEEKLRKLLKYLVQTSLLKICQRA